MMKKHTTLYRLFLALMILICIGITAIHAQGVKLNQMQKTLAALEASTGGRIGLFAIDTANNREIQYRAQERFPMCSTAKLMVVSAILKRSMSDNVLQQKINITKNITDSSGYAPITEKHEADGMSVLALCQAAMTHSDNAAMNLLMRQLGGPIAVTRFAHAIGDNSFRLERSEPELNSAIPGDIRDTTTPEAMAKSLEKLALGAILAPSQRAYLVTWLKNNTTGNNRMRAGVPKGWVVGDKTGTGDYGSTNDIGIIWPPHGSPLIVAIYFTQNKKDAKPRDDVIASITQLLIYSLREGS